MTGYELKQFHFYFSFVLVLCKQSASAGPFCLLVSIKHTFLSSVFFFMVVWLMLYHHFPSCTKYFSCLEPGGENTYTHFLPLTVGQKSADKRCVLRRCLICEERILQFWKKVYAHIQKKEKKKKPIKQKNPTPLLVKVFHFSILILFQFL